MRAGRRRRRSLTGHFETLDDSKSFSDADARNPHVIQQGSVLIIPCSRAGVSSSSRATRDFFSWSNDAVKKSTQLARQRKQVYTETRTWRFRPQDSCDNADDPSG